MCIILNLIPKVTKLKKSQIKIEKFPLAKSLNQKNSLQLSKFMEQRPKIHIMANKFSIF